MTLPGIKLFDLSGRVAIVTGGSKGLGEAMAAGLASAGADILLTSRREEEAAAAASRIADEFGHRAIGIQADVTSEGDTERLVSRALDELGRIDILVNNAGVNIRGAIDELDYEQFQEVGRTNVDGVLVDVPGGDSGHEESQIWPNHQHGEHTRRRWAVESYTVRQQQRGCGSDDARVGPRTGAFRHHV